MTDNIENFPTTERPPLFVGPFEENCVVVDGRFVPGLTGFVKGDKIWLCIDHRFAQGFSSTEDAYGAAVLIAQASAIAHGYSHFAADSKDKPFASKAVGIGSIDDFKP